MKLNSQSHIIQVLDTCEDEIEEFKQALALAQIKL